MVVALLVTGVGVTTGHFSMWMLVLPVYMLLIGLFAIGVGLDRRQLAGVPARHGASTDRDLVFWFWVTPIFITEKQIPERFRFAIASKPAGVCRASLSRPAAFLSHPEPARLGDHHGLRAHRLHRRRTILPPSEARLCGCAVATLLFVGRGPVHSRNRNIVQAQINAQLSAMMDGVVHDEAANDGDPGHGHDSLATGHQGPWREEFAVVGCGDGRSRLGHAFVEGIQQFLVGCERGRLIGRRAGGA